MTNPPTTSIDNNTSIWEETRTTFLSSLLEILAYSLIIMPLCAKLLIQEEGMQQNKLSWGWFSWLFLDGVLVLSSSERMAENQAEKRSRRGLLGFVFGRRGLWSKKCTADNGNKTPMRSSNASAPCTSNIQFTKSPGNELNSKKLQEYKVSPEPIQNQNQTQIQRPISKPLSNQYPNNNPGPVQQQARKVVPRESIGLSGEIESMITDNQKAKGMMFGNIGNLKKPGTTEVGNKTTVQNSG